MKTRTIIYPLVLMLMIAVPVVRYYVSTPGTNACVIEYADTLGKWSYNGYLYSIKWQRHIEPANSNLNDALKPYRIGTANGCLMSSDNLYYDLSNTFYCTVSYLIQKAPVDQKLKTPMGIMKGGDIK